MVDVSQPLKPRDARRLIDAILTASFVHLSDHAVKEMEKDDLDMGDALNILRAGIIAFESETTLVIVTAWRKKS